MHVTKASSLWDPDIPTMMDCNLDLWVEINPLARSCFGQSILIGVIEQDTGDS